MLMPTDIRDAVEQVIRRSPNYLSAYQILERLPAQVRNQVLSERGDSGQGGGQRYTPVSVVTQAARLLCDAGVCEFIYIDGGNIHFEIAGDLIQAGNSSCACYRVRR
jgi:hypothetical protein